MDLDWAAPIEMEQGTSSWLKWRQGGIGSSEAAIIMGVSPWKTPYQLWYQKVHETSVENETNPAMQRGHELEPVARSAYEKEHRIVMRPMLKTHPKHDFLRASLDGCNDEARLILEIKCVNKDDHATALKGAVPEKYKPQLDHQLLVTGFDRVHYFSYDGKVGALVEYKRDEESLKRLLEEELRFWSFIETKTPPPYTDRDYVQPDDFLLRTMMSEWKLLKRKMNELEIEEKTMREDIERFLPHPRVEWAGVKIQRVQKKGSIDYSSIPELREIDLERYRKEGSDYYRYSIGEEADE